MSDQPPLPVTVNDLAEAASKRDPGLVDLAKRARREMMHPDAIAYYAGIPYRRVRAWRTY